MLMSQALLLTSCTSWVVFSGEWQIYTMQRCDSLLYSKILNCKAYLRRKTALKRGLYIVRNSRNYLKILHTPNSNLFPLSLTCIFIWPVASCRGNFFSGTISSPLNFQVSLNAPICNVRTIETGLSHLWTLISIARRILSMVRLHVILVHCSVILQ